MTFPDTDDVSVYGGAIADYRKVPDPSVERSAEQTNALAESVAGISHCAFRAVVIMTAANPAVRVAHYAAWGDGASVAPTVARTGTGEYTITWATTYNDGLGVSHAVNLRAAVAQQHDAAAAVFFCHAKPTSANVVTVRVMDSAGAPADANTDFVVLCL